MSRRKMSPRERWLSAVCDLRTPDTAVVLPGNKGASAKRQPGSFRAVMIMLSMYADHNTGANARPSLRLMQEISQFKHQTVRRALDVAEAAGYIVATDTWTPPNGGDPITVWSLGYPTPDGFQPWNINESEKPPNRTTIASAEPDHRTEHVGESAERNVGGSTERNGDDSTVRGTTSSTSRPEGREVERERDSAPPPDGGARPRLSVDMVKRMVEEIVPTVAYGTGIKCDNLDLVAAFELALERGWEVDMLRQQLADMPAPRRSPTGLLIRRLKALADTDPSSVALPPPSEPESSVADPLADADQRALRRFCKLTGADEEELRAALVGLASKGSAVEADLSPEDEDDHPQLSVQDVFPFDGWRVQWTANRLSDGIWNYISATVRDVALLDPTQRQQLEALGETAIAGDNLRITPPTSDLETLLRLVNEISRITEQPTAADPE